MRAPLDKIVVGAKLRSNDKRTLGKEVEITRVEKFCDLVRAAYKTNTRTAWVSSKDIYVDGHKIARGWALVGATL